MSYQHKGLAAGRWNGLPLLEQMAHVGSEVERALRWKMKGNADYCLQACARALELLDLSLDNPKNKSHLREIARIREALADYFWGKNEFASTENSWQKYFSQFAYAARRKH
jgi:hypothetical protein